jgi:serine/alanine adding enzyme
LLAKEKEKAALLKVVLATQNDRRKWDEFVLSRNDSTLYHLFGWLTVIEDTYKLKPFYFMAVDDDETLQGILPVFETRTITGGRGACSLPFCNYGGICARNHEAENLLLNSVREMALDAGWKTLQLRHLKPLDQCPQADKSHVTQIVQLPQDSKVFWKNMNRKLRWMVNKAQQGPLKKVTGRDRIRDFYLVYSENMRDLGTPTHPESFFRRVLEIFPLETDLIMLYNGDDPVSGMLTFRFKESLSDPWASSRRKYFNLYPNYLLYSEALTYAISLQTSCFDMGRSQPDTGTFRFKSKWGAQTKQLYYIELIDSEKGVSWESKKSLLKIISRAYKYLPLSFSRIIGPKLRKYLP